MTLAGQDSEHVRRNAYINLLVGILGRRVDSASSGDVQQKATEQGSRVEQGQKRASRGSVTDEQSQSDSQFERISRPFRSHGLSGRTCGRSKLHSRPMLKEANLRTSSALGESSSG